MPAVRSTRSKTSQSPSKSPAKSIKALKSKPRRKGKAASEEEDEDHLDVAESSSDDGHDAYEDQALEGEDQDEDEDVKSLDSDALDDDEIIDKSRKRKRVSTAKKSSKAKSSKKKKKDIVDESEDDFEVKEGQEVVGTVVQAPKTGRVPAGQISKNTFNFLTKLKDPKCNDREWFKLNEPVYRLAEQEWKDFVEEFTTVLVDGVDSQIPHLPPKDCILRIYRDVRFSNDKTPYKMNFAASFSRGGRKGIFAHYYIQIQPGNKSFLAAGLWQPGKNELETLRSHIKHSSANFRSIISAPEFVAHFGEPKPVTQSKSAKKGHSDVDFFQRSNIFGREDELKVAPKGIDKNHPDIDLLKCRSFAVVHRFVDDQVLAPDFKEELAKVAKVVQPFVRCLNNMITLPIDQDDSDDDDE